MIRKLIGKLTMRKNKDELLNTNFFQGLALTRTNLQLTPTRGWTIDRKLLDVNDPKVLIPAYALEQLISPKYEKIVKFAVSGDFKVDIPANFLALMDYYKSKRLMPYRIWNGSSYITSWNGCHYLIRPDGELIFAKMLNGHLVPIEEAYLRKVIVEPFTGYYDFNSVPIYDNDCVIYNKSLLTVSRDRSGDWMAGNDSKEMPFNVRLSDCLNNVRVLSSSRNPIRNELFEEFS
jgi:hypothetical protein